MYIQLHHFENAPVHFHYYLHFLHYMIARAQPEWAYFPFIIKLIIIKIIYLFPSQHTRKSGIEGYSGEREIMLCKREKEKGEINTQELCDAEGHFAKGKKTRDREKRERKTKKKQK